MAKHGKNRTANPVYSQRERDKDKALSKWGTQKRRAGSEAVTPFDCCSLSTAPCKLPVITKEGYLYDKEYILENLLQQKADIRKRIREYEAQKKKIEAAEAKKAGAAAAASAASFLAKERGIASKMGEAFEVEKKEVSQAGKMLAMKKETRQTEEGRVVPKLPAFWLPTLAPEAAAAELPPPNTKTKCPMSGKSLKIKDLIPVNFKLADQHSDASLYARKERYVCALTDKVLRNCVPCVVLRPTGRVITAEAFEKLVKPEMADPISGEKLTMKDIIPMKSAGTGYAGGGAKVKKQKTAVAQYA